MYILTLSSAKILFIVCACSTSACGADVACTYSPESERVLNWESAHAQVECAHAPSKRKHAQVRRACAGAHDSEGRARVAGLDPNIRYIMIDQNYS